MAFQQGERPEQLKNRLLLIAQNKIEEIQSLEIEPCGSHCLSFYSKTGFQFQIKKDSSLTEPEITLSPSTKILKIPSYDWLNSSSSDSAIKRWLIGHEIHPYTSPSKIIQYTEAQNIAFKAFKQALFEGVRSFLHIAPTSAGKTLVLARALKEKLQNNKKNKISFVTAHQIKLVDQLFDTIQQELKDINVTVINWNNRLNKDFYLEVERSTARSQPTVFVITSQSLKNQLNFLQRENLKVYNRLTENTDGIYIDEAHHLGAFHTKSALLQLQERSGAFLYGSTATPIHHEINLRDFFEREHWSYLSSGKKEDLFSSHPPEKVMEQLSLGIERGEITPFEDLYIVGESKKFNATKEHPIFIQMENNFRVFNPYHYNRLAGILHRIFSSNKKGFIVTASIAEAKRLTNFLNEAIEGVTFEAYHSEMSREQRQEVERHSEQMESHYIVAVKALDEGVNLPYLSAYIDLNVNVSVKQMVHRIGRVLRLHPGKTKTDILFLADYRNQEMAKDLLQLLDIMKRSPFHNKIRYSGSSKEAELRRPEVVPFTRQELRELREELEQSARNFWSNKRTEKLPHEEVIEIFRRKNIMWEYEWEEKKYTDPELQHIPKKLHQAYPEWSWRQLRGEIPKVNLKNKPPYKELINTLIRRNIISEDEWNAQREQHSELQRFPKNLLQGYQEWKGWKPFREQIGKGKPTYKELIEILIRKNIISRLEWKAQRETDPELQRFPKILDTFQEWKGWKLFPEQIGKEKPSNKEELSDRKRAAYERFIKTLIRKNITSRSQWKKQRETDPELKHFPKILESAYPDWKGWPHFRKQIGKGKPSREELINILRRKNIMTKKEWETQWKIDPELQHIPKDLPSAYPRWSWYKVKGKPPRISSEKKPPYNILIEVLKRKNNITSQDEWEIQRDRDPELHPFPKDLRHAYPNEWKGWPHFRGEKPPIKRGKKPPYEELIETLKRKNIMWEYEWNTQRETDTELKYFPTRISKKSYPEWKGWPHLREQLKRETNENE